MVRVVRLSPNEEKTIECEIPADLHAIVAADFNIKGEFELLDMGCGSSNGTESVFIIKEKAAGEEIKTTTTAQPPFVKFDTDITPDVDLLIHNGEGYDMVSALSELIDNSIQNTAANEDRRQISINFLSSGSPTSIEEIKVFDNGCGMSVDGVKQWAILGRTHHLRRLSSTPIQQLTDRAIHSSKTASLTSDFSRFGVGSKKAVFSLGDSVTVTTRSGNSPWVCECTLSKNTIKQTGWSTSISVRIPTHDEGKLSSFTLFSITGLSETHRVGFNEDFIVSWFGHIYHYYIYGPKGNRNDDDDDNSSDEEDETNIPTIDLLVNGKNLRHHDSIDGETILLNKGVERFSFDIPLSVERLKSIETPTSKTPMPPGTILRPAPGRNDDQDDISYDGINGSQPTQIKNNQPSKDNSVSPVVKVVIYYYPFKDGLETMPIPAGVHIDNAIDDERLPLCDRRPGMELFWNGRMLPRDFLDLSTWPFLKNCLSPSSQISHTASGTERLPPACYRRVKGQIFLDSSFEVTANKHALNRETILVKALLRFSHRTLSQKIRRWITTCHQRHDEELIFGNLDKDLMRGDGTCYYTEVKVSSMNLLKGMFILTKQPNGRGKLIGKITAIFRSPDSEAYHGCFVTMLVSFSSTHNSNNQSKTQDGTQISIPVGLIQKTLTAKEADSELQKVRKNNPTVLKLSGSLIDGNTSTETVGGKKVKKREHVTYATIQAGLHKSKKIIIKLCNDAGKVMAIRGATVEVSIAATPTQGSVSENPIMATFPCSVKASGEFVIQMSTVLESHSDFLQFSGKYIFSFRTSSVTVPVTELIVTVIPCLKISDFFITNSTSEPELSAQLGKPLQEIHFGLTDEFNNCIPYNVLCETEAPSVSVAILERETSKVVKQLLINSDEFLRQGTKSGLSLKNIIVTGVIPSAQTSSSDVLHFDLEVTLVVGEKIKSKSKKMKHKSIIQFDVLKAGRPVALEADSVPTTVGWREAFYLSMLLKDEWGNLTSSVGNTATGSQIMCRITAIGRAQVSNKRKDVVADFTTCSSQFSFSDISLLPIDDIASVTESVEISLQAVLFYRLKSSEKKTNITTTCTIEVKPPTSYPHLVIECKSHGIDHSNPAETFLPLIDVGDDLSGITAQFIHPPSWASSAVVSSSWSVDSVSSFSVIEGRVIVSLPDIIAPTKVSKVIHEIKISDSNDSENCFNHKISISYQNGTPTKLKIIQYPKTITISEAIGIQMRVCDKFGNELRIDDGRLSKVKSIKLTIPTNDTVDDNKHPKNNKTTIQCSTDIKKRDTTWSLRHCVVEGKSQDVDIVATMSVGGTDILSDPISVTILPGEGKFITVDGQKTSQKKPFCVTKYVNFSTLPPLRIGLMDAFGNECSAMGKRVILQCKDQVKLISLSDKKHKSQSDGREGVFTPALLIAAQPGSISGSLSSIATATLEKMDQIEPAVIKLTIKSGKLPWGAKIVKLNEENKRIVTAGTAISSEPITATILCEDQSECTTIPSDRVSLELCSAVLHSPIRFRGPSEPSQVSVKASIIKFPELQNYTPTAAGTYSGKIEIDLNYHPHSDHLEKLKCVHRLVDSPSARFTFEVRAATPNRLNCRLLNPSIEKKISKKKLKGTSSESPFGSWSDSHHVGAVSGGKSLILGAEVRAEDMFGNAVCSLNGVEVTYEIQKYTDTPCDSQIKRRKENDLVPKAEQLKETTLSLSNGIATLPCITLQPDSPDVEAPNEGTYSLTISVSIPGKENLSQLLSSHIIFHYTDNAAKEKALGLLATRRGEWICRQQYLEKKIQKIEARRAAIDEVEDNWDARIKEVQKEMLATRKLKSPNWATFDAAELAKQTASALRKIEREAADEDDPNNPTRRRKKNFGYDKSQSLKVVADRRNCSSEIIGCISEFGFIKDENVDICISKSLSRFMQTVVLATSSETASLKKDLSKYGTLPLLSLDNFNHATLNSEGRIASLTSPNPRPQGWIGYAANIIDIEERNYYLRPVFFNLLGNKVVFDNVSNARSWRQQLLSRSLKAPPIICLDGEKMEQSGIEWAGQQSSDLGYRFGTMSPCSTERYKSIQKLHKLLETYADLQEERTAERNQRSQIETLQQKEGSLRSEVRDVTQTIKTISRLLDTDPASVSGAIFTKLMDSVPPAPSQLTSGKVIEESKTSSKKKSHPKRSSSPPVPSEGEDVEDDYKLKRSKTNKSKK